MASGRCHLLLVVFCACLMVCLAMPYNTFPQPGDSIPGYYHRAFPVIEPDSGHTKLTIAKEGVNAIARITTPIAAVAIREADISRLSFAVELAEEFYGRVKGRDIAFQPAKLLWLIQRDFLGVSLPLSEGLLRQAHDDSMKKVMHVFEEQRFGRHHIKTSVEKLETEIQKAYDNLKLANEYKSGKLCETLYTRCEDRMDGLQDLKLPSMAKFNAGFIQCNRSFEEVCHGPSKDIYEQRILKMLGKARLQFIKDYNNRLFNWLVVSSLAMVVVGRFILKFLLLEVAAWMLFIFLETYTRIFWSPESLYYNPIVTVWETVIYSPILDLDRWAIPLAWLSMTLLLFWRCYGRRKRGGGPLLPVYDFQRGGSNPRLRRSE